MRRWNKRAGLATSTIGCSVPMTYFVLQIARTRAAVRAARHVPALLKAASKADLRGVSRVDIFDRMMDVQDARDRAGRIVEAANGKRHYRPLSSAN